MTSSSSSTSSSSVVVRVVVSSRRRRHQYGVLSLVAVVTFHGLIILSSSGCCCCLAASDVPVSQNVVVESSGSYIRSRHGPVHVTRTTTTSQETQITHESIQLQRRSSDDNTNNNNNVFKYTDYTTNNNDESKKKNRIIVNRRHRRRVQQQQQQQQEGAMKISSSTDHNNNNAIEQLSTPSIVLSSENFVKDELAIEQIKEEDNNNNPNPTAIIHIGPHKTGSTTIQSYLRNYLQQLEHDDNYILPGNWSNRPKGAINMMGLVKCFVPTTTTTTTTTTNSGTNNINDQCDEQSFNDISTIGSSKQSNLLLTAESFAYSNVNVKKVYDTIRQYYTDDNIRVVAYYRRFYDWLVSYWNQMNKQLPYDQRETFVQYVQNTRLIDTMYYTGPYLYGTGQKWEEYFTNVLVYNLYNLTRPNDSTGTFLCDAIPNAINTCTTHMNRPPAQKKKHINESPELVYDDLFYTATKLLNLDFDTTSTTSSTDIDNNTTNTINTRTVAEIRRVLIRKVQEYQEITLQLTSYDFDYIICPDDSILQMLIDRTKQTERTYFPDYYIKQGETEIDNQFNLDKHTKLCTVNATAVIQNSVQWQEFFHQLEKEHFVS